MYLYHPLPRLSALLRLGLKFCIKYKTPPSDSTKDTIGKMQRDVGLKCLFTGEPENESYNKNIYIKSN